MRRRRLDDFAGEGGDTRADRGGHVNGTETRWQAMESLEIEVARSSKLEEMREDSTE